MLNTIKSTSRRQGRFREEWSEGSLSAKVRADEQKPHKRLSLRASWHDTTKPTGSGDRVNAAVMHGKFTFLSGEICLSCVSVSMSVIMTSPEAPCMATCRGSRQKSAEGITRKRVPGSGVVVTVKCCSLPDWAVLFDTLQHFKSLFIPLPIRNIEGPTCLFPTERI